MDGRELLVGNVDEETKGRFGAEEVVELGDQLLGGCDGFDMLATSMLLLSGDGVQVLLPGAGWAPKMGQEVRW